MDNKGWPRDLRTGPKGGHSTGAGGGLSTGPGGIMGTPLTYKLYKPKTPQDGQPYPLRGF